MHKSHIVFAAGLDIHVNPLSSKEDQQDRPETFLTRLQQSVHQQWTRGATERSTAIMGTQLNEGANGEHNSDHGLCFDADPVQGKSHPPHATERHASLLKQTQDTKQDEGTIKV